MGKALDYRRGRGRSMYFSIIKCQNCATISEIIRIFWIIWIVAQLGLGESNRCDPGWVKVLKKVRSDFWGGVVQKIFANIFERPRGASNSFTIFFGHGIFPALIFLSGSPRGMDSGAIVRERVAHGVHVGGVLMFVQYIIVCVMRSWCRCFDGVLWCRRLCSLSAIARCGWRFPVSDFADFSSARSY